MHLRLTTFFSRPLLGALLLAVPFISLQADTIYLKNGQTLTGDIVGQTRTQMSIQTTAGLKRLQKSTVRRVVFSSREKTSEAAARKAREEAARKARETTAREARETAARKAREQAAARKAQEEAARKAETEAEQQAREEAEAARVPITRGGALWRSLVLPGWGQFYQGRTFAGFGYGGAFVAAGAWTASSASEYRSRQSALDTASANLNFSVVVLGAGLPFFDPSLSLRPQIFGLQYFNTLERSSAQRAAEEASRNLKIGSLLLGAVYLANIVDVAIYHPAENMSVAVYTSPASGAGLRFQLRF